MIEDPFVTQQRLKVEREALLEKELDELSKQAIKSGRITGYGYDPSRPDTPWRIHRNDKEEYYSMEDAKSELEKIISE